MAAVERSRARRWHRSIRAKPGSDTIFQGGAAWIRRWPCSVDGQVVVLAQEGSELVSVPIDGMEAVLGGAQPARTRLRPRLDGRRSARQRFVHRGSHAVRQDERDVAILGVESHVRTIGSTTFDVKPRSTSSSLPTFPLGSPSSCTFRHTGRAVQESRAVYLVDAQPPLNLSLVDRVGPIEAEHFRAKLRRRSCGSRWSSVAVDASTGAPRGPHLFHLLGWRDGALVVCLRRVTAASSSSPPRLVSRGYVQNGIGGP